MNERLLQFIWQFQYFNQQQLYTTEEEPLFIEKPGIWNHHQGPDFSEAVIRLGTTKWVGNIEIHLLSSDWYKHHHSNDNHYTNIILHVVWEDDKPVTDLLGNQYPTLILQNRITKILLDRYSQMLAAKSSVPCRAFLPALGMMMQ